MASYDRLSKKQNKKAERANKQQTQENTSGRKFMHSMFNALLHLSASEAVDLLKQPKAIVNSVARKGAVVCDYALHALALALPVDNPVGRRQLQVVLSSMPDDLIATLKQGIAIAQGYKRPNRQFIEDKIEERSVRKVEDKERAINAAMLASLRISKEVDDSWDDAVKALNDLQAFVDNFKRIRSVSMQDLADDFGMSMSKFYWHKRQLADKYPDEKVDSWFVEEGPARELLVSHYNDFVFLWNEHFHNTKYEDTSEYWPLSMLLNKLDIHDSTAFAPRQKRMFERYPEREKEIKSWFFKKGQKKYFVVEHWDEYKQLFDSVCGQPRKKTKADAAKSAVETVSTPKKTRGRKPTVTKSSQAQTEQVQLVSQHPKNQVDVVALQHQLEAWQQMFQQAYEEQAAKDLQVAEEKCKDLIGQAAKVDAVERDELFRQMKLANDEVLRLQEAKAQAKEKAKEIAIKTFNKGSKMLQDRQQLADQLDALDKDIVDFFGDLKKM